MIDLATGWVEICALPGAQADHVSNEVELALLTRYPQPTKIILDRGNEFLAEFKTLIKDDFDVALKPITAQNPQANSILEHVHQTIGNIIHTMKEQDIVLDNGNPWDGILASTMFALRATVHTTTRFTPTQLVFGRYAVLNTPRHEADWHVIKERKQKLMNRRNDRENRKRQSHTYKVGDQILLKNEWKTKFNQDAYKGLLRIIAARNNGIVRARFGRVTDTYNLHNIKPYRG